MQASAIATLDTMVPEHRVRSVQLAPTPVQVNTLSGWFQPGFSLRSQTEVVRATALSTPLGWGARQAKTELVRNLQATSSGATPPAAEGGRARARVFPRVGPFSTALGLRHLAGRVRTEPCLGT